MSAPDQVLAYSWDGPPKLELWTEEVSRHGRSWRQHRLVADNGTPGVVVVAVRDGSFAMVDHWRQAVGRSFLEFPRGFGTPEPEFRTSETAHPSERILADAARELREETGLEGTDLRLLGMVWADTSLLAGSAAVVAARVTGQTPGPRDGEIDGLRWVPIETVPALMAGGEIADGLTLSAYAHWLAADAALG